MDLLFEEENKILTQRRSPEERQKNFIIASNRKVQQYTKDGSKGNLELDGTPITSLPDNLTVGGFLNLWGAKITSLPNNLTVGRDLNLNSTKITSLPSDLKVVGDLYISYTPLTKKYTEKQIKQMVPGVKGNIYF